MIYNIGSINVDNVYRCNYLPAPGETISALEHRRLLGGKGINQSIAIVQAGGEVCHIGAVGPDGAWVLEQIEGLGISSTHIMRLDHPDTGHAAVCVDTQGENSIIISGGANRALTLEHIRKSLETAGKNDWLLLQNETNLTGEIAQEGRAKGCKVAYAAAPFLTELAFDMLPLVDLLCVNETEARQLSEALGKEVTKLEGIAILLTRGARGAAYIKDGVSCEQPACEVDPRDTTGAGDTFLGSFMAFFAEDSGIEAALRYASAAAAIQVTRQGAATAIPSQKEVTIFLKESKYRIE